MEIFDLANLEDAFSSTTTLELIEEANTTRELPRPYLGMSQLGDECWRKLFLYFRWTAKSEISGRVNRIFQTGHGAEEFMVKDLESVGVECSYTLNNQLELNEFHGHISGHSDGVGIGIPEAPKTKHLLEFKTSGDKYFKQLVKSESVETTKPVHYAQMVLYMYKMELTRALYLVYNKNDSSYYMERINENTQFAKMLIEKGKKIVGSDDLGEFRKVGSGKPSWFECRFCNFSDVCHGIIEAEKNCRTCKYSVVIENAEWGCNKHEQVIPLETQKGCYNCHEYLESLKIDNIRGLKL